MNINNIENKFRTLRKEKGYTIETVAEKIDASISTVSSFERGKGNISLTTFIKMLEAIDVNPNNFFNNDKNDIEILNLINKFPKNQKNKLISIIKSILEMT